eukprot:TRINITY_DN2822_c0_g1_i1.p3 TRINITY_DN2822_c0_g1~~TRINITY_DN2822_c0_g1_i1.p3  ORF type:complete len:75 (+),score=9.07 TRINITY_DN2822_c0_g1_i1:246-470(+)
MDEAEDLFARGEWNKCITICSKAIVLNNTNARAFLLRAKALSKCEHSNAADSAKKALAWIPSLAAEASQILNRQ